MNKLRLVLGQQNFLVGDIEGNADKIIACIREAKTKHHGDVIIFPELALTGYPPEDLLYRPELYQRISRALSRITAETHDIGLILGYPDFINGKCYNRAAYIHQGLIQKQYSKQELPNYSIFDEKRYFVPGEFPCIVEIQGIKTAITICEDLWVPQFIEQAKQAGAELVVSINASPFTKDKAEQRIELLGQRASQNQLPIVYVNHVCGQDELVFDGGSMVVNAQGEITQRADFFTSGLYIVDLEKIDDRVIPQPQTVTPLPSQVERIYHALVLGVRDYIEKNVFPRAILGLSGGIDSALTLAIAVDAIGKDRVQAVMMPSRYTSQMSLDGAHQEVEILGVSHCTISIEPIFQAFIQGLEEEFKGLAQDSTEENLQARCRGTLLMAISNKKHAIVLATGNKSEMAVGYSTLYGDMVGGFCVLKDVSKTLVYELAKYRNSLSYVIPHIVIDRPPTAELAENQLDQDTLPPYSILDAIIERYIERDESPETIIAAGYDAETVSKVIQAIDRNEYKRRQAAPGVRITERAFGKDRRYPITSGFGRRNR